MLQCMFNFSKYKCVNAPKSIRSTAKRFPLFSDELFEILDVPVTIILIIAGPDTLCHLICLRDQKYHISCAHDAVDIPS